MNPFPLLIDGKMVQGDRSLDVINPATEAIVASCSAASPAQMDEAIAAAKRAFPDWAARSIHDRKAVVHRIADRLEANQEEIARLLTQEQGKPLAEATGEVLGLAAFCRYFTSLDLPIEVLEDSAKRRVEAHRMPLGVVAAIVPWNFPLILLGFKLAPALIPGNTLVIKPAPTTPLATLRIAELICDIVPPGVINVVADANDLGSQLTSHPDVRKVSFTGSTATGSKVMASAAKNLARITLELGGNDAGIVLDDVDPKAVAPALFQSAFGNSGQVCIALKRLYVHEGIYDELCDELGRLADAARVGNGLDAATTHGPLQNKAQYDKVNAILDEARDKGRIVAGGTEVGGAGFFIRPTVVADIAEGTRLVDEEQFGPVLPVIRYSDPEDAIARANANSQGLGGSVWSSDADRALGLARRLEAGTVWVNKHADLDPAIPFGGAKVSGIGSELGEEGLHEFTQLKVINIAV